MMRGRSTILPVAVVLWLVALYAWVGADPRLSATAYDQFSTWNTSGTGLSQAYAYLAARRGATVVRRLTRELVREKLPRGATVLRIGTPAQAEEVVVEEDEKSKEAPPKKSRHAKPEEKTPPPRRIESLFDDAAEAWVRAGGRLVIALSANSADVVVETAPCSGERQVFPIEPPLPKSQTPRCRTLGGPGLQRFHSLLINDAGPVLARWPLGAGEVILFAMPEAFTNEHLGKGGNLELLDRLAGTGRVVYFDETIHGIAEEGSVAELLVEEWGLGPALVILAAAAIAAFWRRARPTGPPERDERDVRSDAADLVHSLGQLYDRSVDREEALRLYYQGLVRAVHARTRLKGEALERLVRGRTSGYDPKPRYRDISREEFQRMLKILNQAYETVGYAKPH